MRDLATVAIKELLEKDVAALEKGIAASNPLNSSRMSRTSANPTPHPLSGR